MSLDNLGSVPTNLLQPTMGFQLWIPKCIVPITPTPNWNLWLTITSVTVALSTNFIGYGLAGLTRRFLVYPSQAVWPINLATVAFMHAFHTESNDVVNSWAISRIRWFMYCFTAMFIYFWFPGYILQAMSYFNWITWISPSNVKLAAIVGSVNGLGFNPLPTFDWVQIVQFYDPLVNPFFVSVIFPCVIVPMLTCVPNSEHHECKISPPKTQWVSHC